MDNKEIINKINVHNGFHLEQEDSPVFALNPNTAQLVRAISSKKQRKTLSGTIDNKLFPNKNFDGLDRETQLKILSSEKRMLQNGIKDFISKNNNKNELDPFSPRSPRKVKRKSVKSLNENKGSRKSSIKILKCKTNTPVYSLEQERLFDKVKKKVMFSPSKRTMTKSSIRSVALSKRSKSFSEDSLILLSPVKLHKQQPICLSPIKKSKSKISVHSLSSPRRLRPDVDGLKMKLSKNEKIEIKKTLHIVGSSDEEKENEHSKGEIRELIKLNQVYDSMSDEEVESEEETQFVIFPKSPFKYMWDLLIFFLALYSIVTSPLAIAFDFEDKLALFIDILFFIDLILNFWMGYYDDEENLIISPKKIILNYIFGWFWIDLISCIPFNTLKYYDKLSMNIYYLCLFRILKNLKIQNSTNVFYMKIIKRIFCFNHDVKQFYRAHSIIPQGLKKLINNFIRFVIIIHTLSCIWIFLSRLSPGENWAFKLKEAVKISKTKLYLTSVYFNMVSVLTLGYGDILPVSLIERCYSIFLLIISLGINTYAVSFLENLADLGNQKNAKLESKKDFLENISINYKVNYELYEKILNYLKYTYQFEADEKEKFIDYLPTALKNTLICNMYKNIIDNFTFFKLHKDDNIEFKSRILLALRPIITYKGEEVIKVNQFVDEIIFVKSGQLSMFITYKGIHVRLLYLRKYENFGEILIVTNERSPVGLKVISGTTTELLLLRKEDFFSILNDFTENFRNILKRSSENLKRIKKVIAKKKSQIRKMITQTKLFKQATKVLNYNNTIAQCKEAENNLVKYNTNPLKEITFNINNHNSTNIADVSSSQNTKGLNITLNMTNDDINKSQTVFINLNSANGNAFTRLKEIKVTINNESNHRRLSMLPNSNKLKLISNSDDNAKNLSDCSSKQISKKNDIINSCDNTADGSYLIDSEVVKVKKAQMNIIEKIKQKIDSKTEEIKMNNRLSIIMKKYLDYTSDSPEDNIEDNYVLDNNYIRKYDQKRKT